MIEVRERFATMRDEVHRPGQRDRQDRCYRLHDPDPRRRRTRRRVRFEHAQPYTPSASVVNLEGSCLGSSTLTFAMFDCAPAGNVSFASRLAPLALDVLPEVETVNFGRNGSPAQPETAKRRGHVRLRCPGRRRSSLLMCCCAQSVGLKMNPGRSIVTFAVRNRNGMPSRICGNGSLVTVNAVVFGSTLIRARTTTLPRLNGPACVGTTMLRPNGAPSYGPGQIDRALLVERVPAGTSRDGHRPDPRRRRARPGVRLRLPAQRDPGDRPQQARGRLDLDPREVLFAVFPCERQRQRTELPRVRVRRTRTERRSQTAVWTGTPRRCRPSSR